MTETQTFRALTPEDFIVKYDADTTFHFFEDEGAWGLYGFDHIDSNDFARRVNDYDAYTAGIEGEWSEYTSEDVRHAYAKAAIDEDGSYWRLVFCSKDSEFSTKITYISR